MTINFWPVFLNLLGLLACVIVGLVIASLIIGFVQRLRKKEK